MSSDKHCCFITIPNPTVSLIPNSKFPSLGLLSLQYSSLDLFNIAFETTPAITFFPSYAVIQGLPLDP